MDDVDKVLDALKVHIKKEIVDNYFADRVYVEEDTELLHQEVQDYDKGVASLGRRFMALYHALGTKEACAGIMEVLKFEHWPFYQDYDNLSGREQLELLQDTPLRGFTAYRRFRNRIFDLYKRLQQESVALQEAYAKVQTHLKLLNEDIDKFNLSYDFGLIAGPDGGPGRRPARIHERRPVGPGAGGALHPHALQASEVDGRAIAAGVGPAAPGGDPEEAGKLDRTRLSTRGLLWVIVWFWLFCKRSAFSSQLSAKTRTYKNPVAKA